jgi:hypothetical protein
MTLKFCLRQPTQKINAINKIGMYTITLLFNPDLNYSDKREKIKILKGN